jgi:two-component system, OmpR family, response regulator
MKVLTFPSPGSLQEGVLRELASACVIETASSAEACLQSARLKKFEAVLLDSDPESFVETLTLVELIRYEQPDAALFVFERDLGSDQRVQLLEAGVDDCVHAPLFPTEVAMRVGLSIRLRQAASNLDLSKKGINVVRSGDLELDLVHRTVTRQGRPIDLRPKEFLLLQYLVEHVNRSVTRTMILEHVWKCSFEGLTNVVDVYISSLRSKLDRGFRQKLILTNHGVGYTLTSGGPDWAAEETISERTYRRPG